MTRLELLAALCKDLDATSRRLDKVRLVAEFLRALDADEVAAAVAYLTGRPFSASDARVLGARGLPVAGPAAAEPSLTLADVAEAFAAVAGARGAGSRTVREERLAGLTARATEDERALLWRIITNQMRTGVSDGLVLEAIALATGAAAGVVRRAALVLGDLSVVATLARRGGAGALAGATLELFVPLSPMLAEIAPDLDAVLAAHGGRTALEYKYDGARIQLHRTGDRVAVWTRGLADVTASLPDVVEVARRDLASAPFVLDGEVVALDAPASGGGRP
jgi:DNA ligase-1